MTFDLPAMPNYLKIIMNYYRLSVIAKLAPLG